MTYLLKGSELVLIGDVGDLGLGDPCFTAADVRAGLAKVGRNTRATVRLNSGGGSATEGAAIASAFASHPGRVTCLVEGVAASAASVAACGADRVEMSAGAVMMIHEASAVTIGTIEDHEDTLEGLEAVNAAMARLYAQRSRIPVESVRAMMAAETWMTPDQACDAGFADGIVGEAEPRKPVRFDYAARYRHPPVALLDRLPKAKAPPRRPEPPVILDDEPLDPAELAELCVAAEQPEVAADLIRAKATLPQARARLDVMATIRPMLTLATGMGAPVSASLKAEALSGRLTVAQVRERIFEEAVARSEDPETQVCNKKMTGAGAPDARGMARASMEKTLRAQGVEPVKRDAPPTKPRTFRSPT